MKKNDIIIAYDGECPFCRTYIHMQRLNTSEDNIKLINFRDNPDLVNALKAKNYDPNEGLYLKINEEEYFAETAMTALTLIATSNTAINAIFKWIFKDKKRAKLIYPVLRIGRNIILKLLKKSNI